MSGRSTRLIDKDELLRNIEADIDISVTGVRNMEAVKCCLQTLLDDVRNSPEVDAVPVRHGKWTVTPVYIKCSECGESFMLIPQNYCPNCGAKMDEDS